MTDSEVLIKAEHVSKKFCRSLKRSLWYGAQDVANSLMPWKRSATSGGSTGISEFPMPLLRKDEFWAVRDVSFEVRRGECLGLIGHNGAGKSTLLKILNSLNRPDSGRITMRGRVGALIELGAGFNPILSGRENIYNQATLLGFSQKEIEEKFDEIVDFSELGDFLDMPVQNYSSGMKVRLGFSVAAQMEPDILLLDEVLAVGDIGFQIKCYNKINELADRCAMIFVSHSIPQVAKVCSDLIVMKAGMAMYHGGHVKEGIGLYYDQFKNSKSFISERELLRISGFQIKSSAPESIEHSAAINHGDDLLIEIELSGNVPQRDSISIILKILDQSFIPVVNSQTHKMHFQKKISFRLKNLLLTPGTYMFDAYAVLHRSDRRTEETISYYKSFKTLRVVGGMIENHACFQIIPEIHTSGEPSQSGQIGE